MVLDSLKNAQAYYGLGEGIKAALEFLENNDLAKLNTGKYEIKGTEVFALVQQYETKPLEKGAWEAHRKYIDVQYVLEGCEIMGYANINTMKTAKEYDECGDYLLLEGGGCYFKVDAGSFAVFTPEDVHMPGLAVNDVSDNIRKVVVKVAVR